jgi:hypothetical protein
MLQKTRRVSRIHLRKQSEKPKEGCGMAVAAPILLSGQELGRIAERLNAVFSARDPALAQARGLFAPMLESGVLSRGFGEVPFKPFDSEESISYSAEEREVLAVITTILFKNAPGSAQFEAFAAELFLSIFTNSKLLWQAQAELIVKSEAESAVLDLCSRLIHPSARGAPPKLLQYDETRRFDNWLFIVAANFFKDYCDAQKARAKHEVSIDADDTHRLDLWLSTDGDATHEAMLLKGMFEDDALLADVYDLFVKEHESDIALCTYIRCLRLCDMDRMDAWRRAQTLLTRLEDDARKDGAPDPKRYRLPAHRRELYYYWLRDAQIEYAIRSLGLEPAVAVQYLKLRPSGLSFEKGMREKLEQYCSQSKEEFV